MSRRVDPAALLHAQAELRRRWRSFVVLGLLVGVVVGVAVASASSARRSATIIDRYFALDWVPDGAVAPNDPSFDAADRRAIADLDEVRLARPFAVSNLVAVIGGEPQPQLTAYLPTLPEDLGDRLPVLRDELLRSGRWYDLSRPDEVVIGDDVAEEFGLGPGAVIQLSVDESFGPLDGDPPVWDLTVVGVVDDTENSGLVDASPAFMGAHGDEVFHVDNLFVWYAPDVTGPELQSAAADAVGWDGLPSLDFAVGKEDARKVARLEAAGLGLFALAVVAGGGALVGQALVRAVTVGADDTSTLSALGMVASARRLAVATPSGLTAIVAATTTVVVAFVSRPWFQIGTTATATVGSEGVDALVLVAGLVCCVASCIGVALAAGWWSTRSRARAVARPAAATAAMRGGAPVPVAVGAHLALDPGRGQRAVPVRSALVGSVIGILGVVASLTFHRGIDETLAQPARAGVQATTVVAPNDFSAGVSQEQIDAVRADPAVESAVHATWWRSLPIGDQGMSVWSYEPLAGSIEPTVLDGRLPIDDDEIALGPRTMDAFDVAIGDTIGTTDPDLPAVAVVGRVLVQSDSHQDYDGGGFMTSGGARALGPPDGGEPGVDSEDGFYLRWRADADIAAATDRLAAVDLSAREAGRPANFESLSALLDLPRWLSVFLGLMAVATVAHALATTVRRRRHDLAVLSALGVTPRQVRRAVAVQSMLLAGIGLLVGVPFGVFVGRLLWRTISDTLTLLYVPPLAALAVALIWPVALAVANLLALWPARAAARLRPATVLRSE